MVSTVFQYYNNNIIIITAATRTPTSTVKGKNIINQSSNHRVHKHLQSDEFLLFLLCNSFTATWVEKHCIHMRIDVPKHINYMLSSQQWHTMENGRLKAHFHSVFPSMWKKKRETAEDAVCPSAVGACQPP